MHHVGCHEGCEIHIQPSLLPKCISYAGPPQVPSKFPSFESFCEPWPGLPRPPRTLSTCPVYIVRPPFPAHPAILILW